MHHIREAHPGHGRAPARRTTALRPDLTRLSAAEIRELQAIGAALRPTPGDPVGEAALTPLQVARVRALAAKAWAATQGALVVGLEHDAALSARRDNRGHRSLAPRSISELDHVRMVQLLPPARAPLLRDAAGWG